MDSPRENLEAEMLAYVEGQLSASERARVEVFLLNTDPALADLLHAMMEDRATLAQAPKLRAPADMAERIMERIERTSLLGTPDAPLETHKSHPWWQRRWAIAASLLLIFGLSGYFLFTSILLDSHNPWTDWAHKTTTPAGSGAPTPLALAENKKNEVKWGISIG